MAITTALTIQMMTIDTKHDDGDDDDDDDGMDKKMENKGKTEKNKCTSTNEWKMRTNLLMEFLKALYYLFVVAVW